MQIPAPVGHLDAVGGQPWLPAARSAWEQALARGWSDPSAVHHAGRQTRMLLDAARASIAASLTTLGEEPVRPEEVWLTHSVEAARALVVSGTTGPVVHGAVEALAVIETLGTRGRSVPVDALGRVDAAAWSTAAAGCDLGVLQVANPEVGTTQPVSDATRSVPVLADAVQSVARLPLPGGWTALVAQASDWGGPAGVGVLVARPRLRWTRPASSTAWIDGTADVPSAVAAAMGLESLVADGAWRAEAERASAAVDAIRAAAAAVVDVEVLGDPVDRLPHVVTFSALYVSGEALVSAFDRLGLAVASGSACLQFDRPSHVLAAMGAFTGGNVRVSLPFGFDEASVDRFVTELPRVIGAVRDEALR